MGRLDNKVALITGGARGQGAAEAERFVAEGATVRITDILDDAGIFERGTLADTTLDDWDRMIAINQTGVFLGMQTAAAPMRAAGAPEASSTSRLSPGCGA